MSIIKYRYGGFIMRILIIEDEVRVADIVMKYLEKEGYTVYVAYNGKEGLKIFN